MAEADLDAIDDYIARDSTARARAFTQRIQIQCQRLGMFPEHSMLRPNLGKNIRVLSFDRRVTIVYRIDFETVVIIHILYRGRNVSLDLLNQ